MSLGSGIEWTEATWNFLTGCDKVSPGCKHCYAEILARRLYAMGQSKYKLAFKLAVHESWLETPLQWKKPKLVFVNSMSDIFHQDVPIEIIHQAFSVMKKAHWHTFQILTKRSKRLLELNDKLDWSPNIWMGVSVESQAYISRIEDLRETDAKVKFLSLEPLLEKLPSLNLEGIDWVIVGGESGQQSRPIQKEWVENIRDQCLQASVPFFFKQWGGRNKKAAGRLLDGRTWDEMPTNLQAI